MIKTLRLSTITLLSLTMTFLVIDYSGFNLRINYTKSLPYYLFMSCPLNPKEHLTKNSYVGFTHVNKKTKIAKKIIGIPGDKVTIHGNEFWINDTNYGSLRSQTSKNIALIPIEEKIIPPGYLFVYADHPQSFDSRYQAFGLVAINQIEEQLWPLF
jgi:conjugal transfer pilin signal peptidase TrbI